MRAVSSCNVPGREQKGMNMERTIRVTGRGKLLLQPDTIRLKIDLCDRDVTYEGALQKSIGHVKTVRNAFVGLGFQPEELKTVLFRVDAEQENYRDKEDKVWKKRLVGCKAMHSLKIEFSKERDILGKVLALVEWKAASAEFHVEYTVKDLEDAKKQLLAKAVADSKSKAEVLAEAAGTRLGELLTIDYSWGEVDFVTSPMNRFTGSFEADEMSEFSDYDIEPDNIDAEDTVTVVWKLA